MININWFKKFIKLYFSGYFISKITSISYGWYGNYPSWTKAKDRCSGYEGKQILDKVVKNALKVKNNEIPFERDSVTFNKIIYSFPVLSALMWIAGRKNNRINVLDFGGSLGTSYYQNLFFLRSLSEVNWCIIEQPHFVDEGNKSFADNNLHFFYSINDCLLKYNINVALLSNVIQYIEKPYDLLGEIISKEFEYIIIDRTLFIEKTEDRLTIQKVSDKIYKASYCCWFLSESKFLSLISNKYEMIYDFNIEGNINIKSVYKGYLFKIRKEKNS